MNSVEINQLLKELHGSFEYLPIESSTIAYEIILISMLFFSNKEELSLKTLFANGNFTEMGARYHLNRLVRDQWLEVRQSDNDLRVKFVYPTIGLIQRYEQFHSIRFNGNNST